MSDISSTSSLPVTDKADGADGATAPSITQQVGGVDGSGNLQTLSTDTTGKANTLPFGVYNTTLPSATNGQDVRVQLDSRGRLITSPQSYTYFHPIYTTRIQTATAVSSSNVLTITATITASTAGSLIVVSGSSGKGTIAVTDSAGQSYTTAIFQNVGGTANPYQYIAYKANSAAGVTTVTITVGATTTLNLIVAEYGSINSVPIDQVAAAQATGLNFTSGVAPTTTNAQDLLIGTAFNDTRNNGTFTAGTGWTAVTTAANGVNAGGNTFLEEQYTNAVGAYAATGIVSASDLVLVTFAAFKLASPPANLVALNSSITIKASSGTLSQVIINSLGTSGATVTFYDGSVSAATKIATLSLTFLIGSIPYDLTFLTSLIMVVNSSTADFTVIYN